MECIDTGSDGSDGSDGYGFGSGSGSGPGDGYGDSTGSGYGFGFGSGSGSGSGDGYGYGDGFGSGDGSGYGSYPRHWRIYRANTNPAKPILSPEDMVRGERRRRIEDIEEGLRLERDAMSEMWEVGER